MMMIPAAERTPCEMQPAITTTLHHYHHHHHRHFICPIMQQCAHLHRYNIRRPGQQGPTRTLTAALKRVVKQSLGTYSITQVKYYKREN